MHHPSDSPKTAADRALIDVVAILDANGIPYWACHGTLLGLARDGELIPWDHDIDIAVWADSVSKGTIRELMAARGYVQKESSSDHDLVTFVRPDGRDIDFNFYKISKTSGLAYTEWVIPKSLIARAVIVLARGRNHRGRYRNAVNAMGFLSPGFKLIELLLRRAKCLYRTAGYTTPAGLLADFSFIEYHGVSVRVPDKFEQVLKYLYGPDWRTPKRKYDWVSDSPATRVLKTSL